MNYELPLISRLYSGYARTMNVLSQLQNLFESFKCRSSCDVDLIKHISEIEKIPV